tara:strand:- start:275 stop:427 length:153 start_codon:yes stop_codon:yes gene_type:complete
LSCSTEAEDKDGAIMYTDIVGFTKIMGADVGIEVNQKVRTGDKVYLINND